MGTVLVNKKDEIIMKLVHYFITEENYTPIVVNGVKDEIWLENNDGPYRIVRINSNYIHNNEQYSFDVFKTKNIMKQIKRKTLSFSISTLNIFLDVNPDVKLDGTKNIDSIIVKTIKDIKKKGLLTEIFPSIKEKLNDDAKGVDLIVNVTKDINEKTEKDNKIYEQTFKEKKTVITSILIAINILVFVLIHLGFGDAILNLGANNGGLVRGGEIWRLLTSAFIHYDIFHLFFNMYALQIIGRQIETYVGKTKFLTIYMFSALTGSILSNIISKGWSIGASGAIFGLLGALVYFGYHYRLYLGKALKTQIMPLLFFNLALSFLIKNIDAAAHIGGLVGGFLIIMALGIDGKSKFTEKINGWIVCTLYTLFLIIMNFIII